MKGYRWTLNDESSPNRNSLLARLGERVAIHFENRNGMGHPMHLHGHVFQVVEINGKSIAGPLGDTVTVPAMGACTVLLPHHESRRIRHVHDAALRGGRHQLLAAREDGRTHGNSHLQPLSA